MSASFLIAAGGTGGHMFPALAVAAALRRRGGRVTLLTDARGSRYAGSEPDCRIIEAASPSGSMARRARGLLLLAKGCLQSWRQIAEVAPAAIATFGGYASAPAALVAILRRIPLLVHEQNAVLGKANRLVARFAAWLALSFERTAAVPEAARAAAFVSGNPVRPDFAAATAVAHDGTFEILVLGGSQGARVFSDVLPDAIGLLRPELRAMLRLVQQCRPEDLERVRSAYAALGQVVELASFFDDVPTRMARADLVVSRSGASTVAELLALAKPAILVPYRHAADDHQSANAASLVEAGAAMLLPQAEASAAKLAAALTAILDDPARLGAMAAAAGSLARPAAAELLADKLLAMAERSDRP